MLVASFETPAARGNSPTRKPASSRTRTKFELNGSDSSDSRSKSRVYARRTWERSAERWPRLSPAVPFSRGENPAAIPSEPATIGTYSGSSTSSRSTIDRSEPSELADRIYAEPLRPARVDLVEERRPDLLRLPPGRCGSDDPLLSQRPTASPSLPLDLRRRASRCGRDEDVPPPLHAADRREHPRLRQSRCLGKRTDLDSVADETQEVRPHHDRRDAGALTRLREPALEFVVELDGVRHERL